MSGQEATSPLDLTEEGEDVVRELEIRPTLRGFMRAEFNDTYGGDDATLVLLDNGYPAVWLGPRGPRNQYA